MMTRKHSKLHQKYVMYYHVGTASCDYMSQLSPQTLMVILKSTRYVNNDQFYCSCAVTVVKINESVSKIKVNCSPIYIRQCNMQPPIFTCMYRKKRMQVPIE